MSRQIILASGSQFRADLLSRFSLPFSCVAPEIEERERAGEPPEKMAGRLAGEKAEAVTVRFPHAVVIGSDQVAVCGDEILRKPGTAERACRQLSKLRGREHRLCTAVHIIAGGERQTYTFLNIARLLVRADLTEAQIAKYVQQENPIACAGAYKIEGSGIALFDEITCDDWTAIVGLPLIRLAKILRKLDIELFG